MKILSVDLKISAVRISQYPEDVKSEYLLVGRSNVGKSSFINAILNRKNFARTSAKPGKTRTLNFYLVNENFYIVDVPGYGYAAVDKKTHQKFGMMIEEYITKREQLKMVFMLIDFRHKPTEDDILMYNYLKHFNLPVTLVATKVDKISKSKQEKHHKQIIDSLNIDKEDRLVLFSSVTKMGKDIIHSIIEETN